MADVLRPGGLFIVAFSNRWIPEKVTQIWKELHDFERLGLVAEYFQGTGRYENIKTLSYRGYPRPLKDKYFQNLRVFDPLYLVYAKTKK